MNEASIKVIENTLIPHNAFVTAKQRIEQCYQNSELSPEPVCIALVGESRTGKTRLIEEFMFENPGFRDDNGLNIPVLKVSTPSKPTVKSLAELMLKAINDPRYNKGTENEKTIRLIKLINTTNVRLIVIEEFQHFVDKASKKVMHHVADWLKILIDETKVALLVSGLPSCLSVLEQNEQLAGRFLAPAYLHRFDWLNESDRTEFTNILSNFQQTISYHFDTPELDSEDMALRLWASCGGIIGILAKLLRQMIWNAHTQNTKVITLEDIHKAYILTVSNIDNEMDSPFDSHKKLEITESLIQNALRVGTSSTTHMHQPHPHKLNIQQVLSRR